MAEDERKRNEKECMDKIQGQIDYLNRENNRLREEAEHRQMVLDSAQGYRKERVKEANKLLKTKKINKELKMKIGQLEARIGQLETIGNGTMLIGCAEFNLNEDEFYRILEFYPALFFTYRSCTRIFRIFEAITNFV